MACRYLDFFFSPFEAVWQHAGFGISLDDGLPNHTHAVWADDCIVTAADRTQAASMAQDATNALCKGFLEWKPDSLCILANKFARLLPTRLLDDCIHVTSLTASGAHCRYRFLLVQQKVVLGAMLDLDDLDAALLNHRFGQANLHYGDRRRQLHQKEVCARRVT